LPKPCSSPIIIQRLGAEGDGIAALEDGRTCYVPFTLPRESIHVETIKETRSTAHARALSIVSPAPERINAPCASFGTCGGCQLQHLNESTYAAFKQEKLASVMHRLGVSTATIQPLVLCGYGSRRRLDLAVSSYKGELIIGFHGAFSAHVIDIRATCPIAHPQIQQLLQPLTQHCAATQSAKQLRGIHLQCVNDSSIDITLRLQKMPSASEKEAWSAFAAQHAHIARISFTLQDQDDHPRLIYGQDVSIEIAGVRVALPSGAFLQAASAGQAALTQFVCTHAHNHARILDLYCGLGTFSLPLAQQGSHVTAYEGSDTMIHALHNATIHARLEQLLIAKQHDLFKHPIAAQEINRFDCVVINPPRNGALPQTQQIARSTIGNVIMVSCNPITFERDARCLLQAGFTLQHIQGVDQFAMSSHLEIAAHFVRTTKV
jgi:23S rRNA (uracil1939-C5)-methyltransferase